MSSNVFKRGERLKSSKIISQLFDGSCSSVKGYPLVAVYKVIAPSKSPFPAQAAFSVPKRKFKSAVKRNKVRRKLKEAYRLQKSMLYHHLNLGSEQQLAIMFIYVSDEIIEFNKIEKAVKKVISKLLKELH